MGSKPLMKPSGIIAIVIGAAVAITVAGLGIFSYTILRPNSSSSSAPTTTSSPVTNDNQTAVSALGRLQAGFNGPLKVAAPSTASNSRVVKLLVKEGVIVKAGQPLAVMDSYASLSAALAQAQAQGFAAQARLEQVKAEVKSGDARAPQFAIPKAEAEERRATDEFNAASEALKRVKEQYEKYKLAADQGAISKVVLQDLERTLATRIREYKQAEQAQQQAEQLLEQATSKLNSSAEVRSTDVSQAEAQVQVAIANFQKAKIDQENAIVRAPFDGQIIKLHTNEGETVSPNGILELGRTDQMFAVAEVDENDIRRVQVGQKATITGAALRGETMTGTVVEVGQSIGKKPVLNPGSVDKVDTRLIEVKISLADSKKLTNLTNLSIKVVIEPY